MKIEGKEGDWELYTGPLHYHDYMCEEFIILTRTPKSEEGERIEFVRKWIDYGGSGYGPKMRGELLFDTFERKKK